MANPEHLAIIRQGRDAWNQWRDKHPEIIPDLRGTSLRGYDLSRMNLRRADLTGAILWEVDLGVSDLNGAKLTGTQFYKADLTGAHFVKADLTRSQITEANLWLAWLYRANLCKANLSHSNLRQVIFRWANLQQANLSRTDLREADLRHANLTRAKLINANLIEAKLQGATLSGCSIYGICAWDIALSDKTQQEGLIISKSDEPTITVDNLEVAQFIYLLLRNEKIRHVIDTITSKVVLILGRFTPERKAILDAIKDELRHCDLLPVMFDFQRPQNRSFRETVLTLAHMARFVVADMTDARIVLDEVPHIVEKIAVPLVPLLLHGEDEPVTLYDLRINHRSLLPTCRYADQEELLTSFEEKVIAPAQAKAKELMEMR